MAPVELRMNVHCYKCAKKIRKSVENLRAAGVRRVTASPEQGLVVVYGTADPYVIRQLLMRKMKRPVEIVSHGSAPNYYQHTTCAPPQYYGPPPPPPPPPPPAGSYPYAAEGWADPDPYGYRYRYRYRQHSPEPSCSII